MSGKPSSTPSDRLERMIELFLANKNNNSYNMELEVKFGTLPKMNRTTRNQFDDVAKRLISLGFIIDNSEHILRIFTKFVNKQGVEKPSNVRVNVVGINTISTYCNDDTINDSNVSFEVKKTFKNDNIFVESVDFKDYNFRVSLNEESYPSPEIINQLTNKWTDLKKNFRLMNRTTFRHKDFPFKLDLSIVKSSYKSSTSFSGSGVMNENEKYEIEIEADNELLKNNVHTGKTLTTNLKKLIKYVLSGLQSTNYPVSITEQESIKSEYVATLFPGKNDIKPSFIGPSSYTLQQDNIVEREPDGENKQQTYPPNIRDNYTVTDKADGDRKLLFVAKNERIYLIDTNMNVQFTGAMTQSQKYSGTLMDGEHIKFNKDGKYINLYAVFDIYYVNGKDIRDKPFYLKKKSSGHRYNYIVDTLKKLSQLSIVNNEPSPIRIEPKKFRVGTKPDLIFNECLEILEENSEYKTDGLIFTPCDLGVGADIIGQPPITPKKAAWKHSFKWKPPIHNTIDFLVKFQRKPDGEVIVGNIFKSGTSMKNQLMQYNKSILHVGFDLRDGYPNAFQDVINGKVPEERNNLQQGNRRNNKNYVASRFYPTNPYDNNAAECNLMLSLGANGKKVIKTLEGEVIEDKMVVEFSYDGTKDIGWRWTPLRVRYDKTADQGGARYGNNYNVANNNWNSIHNPVTEEMITTGNGIPEQVGINEELYYNRDSGKKSHTRGLRNYHNWLKNMLIDRTTNKNDTLIDLAVGKGGDLNKWINAELGFVFGIDYSKDNIENPRDGACARYLNALKKKKRVPKSLFVHGDSSMNIRNTEGIPDDEGKNVVNVVFGSVVTEDVSGKALKEVVGIGNEGFNVSSIQFAIHYMFESKSKLHGFLRNVAETTKEGGYFVGTTYDGMEVFKLLKSKQIKKGESISYSADNQPDDTIWQVTKQYDKEDFIPDDSCLGYAIDVYQETINKVFTEYLVNFEYLTMLLKHYGFVVENNIIKTHSFRELYSEYEKDYTRNNDRILMTENEKKISYLNRLFVFKKTTTVDAQKMSEILMKDDIENYDSE